MLVTFRIPIADLRSFYRPDFPKDIRLPPTWSEDHDFVRYFGPVTRRIQGPVDPWPAERVFCRYDNVLRFPPSYSHFVERQIPDLRILGVKRRLYPATSRNDLFYADIQFIVRGRNYIRRYHSYYWDDQEQEGITRFNPFNLVQEILKIPVKVKVPGGIPVSRPIGVIGKSIASAFDAATTVGKPSGNVHPGAPVFTIELEDFDEVSATWEGQWQYGNGVLISGRPVISEGRTINVFALKPGPHSLSRDTRGLRIHVLRLHAERQFLRSAARALTAEGFIDGCNKSQLDTIQYSLNQCLITLTRAKKQGLRRRINEDDFSTIDIAAAFLADQALSGYELQALIERVQNFRPIISRRLRSLEQLEDDVQQQWRRFTEDDRFEKNFIYVREAHVSRYNIRGSQIGAVGDNSSAVNFSFGAQLNLDAISPDDAQLLQMTLRTLRKHLAERLISDSVIEIGAEEVTPIQIGDAIGALSEAERAISDKDTSRTVNALRRSGQWLATFAQEVGIDLAAAAIRKVLHLP